MEKANPNRSPMERERKSLGKGNVVRGRTGCDDPEDGKTMPVEDQGR